MLKNFTKKIIFVASAALKASASALEEMMTSSDPVTTVCTRWLGIYFTGFIYFSTGFTTVPTAILIVFSGIPTLLSFRQHYIRLLSEPVLKNVSSSYKEKLSLYFNTSTNSNENEIVFTNEELKPLVEDADEATLKNTFFHVKHPD
ncbi:MAG: hypothetical protein ACKOAD_08810 [Gammaproteobacteria bacterium]